MRKSGSPAAFRWSPRRHVRAVLKINAHRGGRALDLEYRREAQPLSFKISARAFSEKVRDFVRHSRYLENHVRHPKGANRRQDSNGPDDAIEFDRRSPDDHRGKRQNNQNKLQ